MNTTLEEELSATLSARAAMVPTGAAERLCALEYHPRRRGRAAPVALGATAVGAATAGTALAVVLGGAAPAYAGWSPAPTASTTTMLALGDALAVALSEKRGFKEEDFASLHPGGKLGKRLSRVSILMHSGDALPRVSPSTPISQVIYEMSCKGLGMTTVVEDGRLVGLVSDGDLRRLLEHHGKDVFDLTAGQCMTRNPKSIGPDAFAIAALDIMEQKKITSLPVVDDSGNLLGVLHLHDLWGTEMV